MTWVTSDKSPDTNCQFYTDPDRLAEGLLITNFIWGSRENENPKDYFKGDWRSSGDFTLRNWRDKFYRYKAGRYVKVSETEMKPRRHNICKR